MSIDLPDLADTADVAAVEPGSAGPADPKKPSMVLRRFLENKLAVLGLLLFLAMASWIPVSMMSSVSDI